MSAHPLICTKEFLKGKSTHAKKIMKLQVDAEMRDYIKFMYNILETTVENNDSSKHLAYTTFNNVCKMVADDTDFKVMVNYLNEKYYFAKMPVEYMKLYESETILYNMVLINYIKTEQVDSPKGDSPKDENESTEDDPIGFNLFQSDDRLEWDSHEDYFGQGFLEPNEETSSGVSVDDFIEMLLNK